MATTLLDATIFTAEELAGLFRKRWQVELHIRSLKTQMQMEHLRCKSPQMVRKEVRCHMIGYNLVRASMVAMALQFRTQTERLSFTNAMQALNEFANCLRLRSGRVESQWNLLLETIAETEVGHRSGRQEERVIQRPPKNYKPMKTQRNSNRSRYAVAS